LQAYFPLRHELWIHGYGQMHLPARDSLDSFSSPDRYPPSLRAD